jgi:hypothetical protein
VKALGCYPRVTVENRAVGIVPTSLECSSLSFPDLGVAEFQQATDLAGEVRKGDNRSASRNSLGSDTQKE